MKSVKPGRGPSKRNMVGSIGAALFGIFWTFAASSMGAYIMVPFGLIFIGIAIYDAIYSYRNLTSEDRYSIVDIVDENEETDPLNLKYRSTLKAPTNKNLDISYCPYCGHPIESNYEYCPKCGKKLPK